MMNVKELTQLLKLVSDIIDGESVKICMDNSRDGSQSFVQADVRFTKDTKDSVVLVVGYPNVGERG